MTNDAAISAEIQLTPIDHDRMRQAAEVLLAARRTRESIENLPPDLQPQTIEEAYAIQDMIAEALGPSGGWKVGRTSPDAIPVFSPMPMLGFAASGATLAANLSRYRGLEAEVAFLLGADLPPRPAPYSREEAEAAIATSHPVIEVLETAYTDPDAVAPLARIADLQMNGGFIHGGGAVTGPRTDFKTAMGSMSVDGVVRVEAAAPDGFDPLGLLTWLANQPRVHRAGGLKAGDWVTTGSWTGKVCASPGSMANARFSSFGECIVSFE